MAFGWIRLDFEIARDEVGELLHLIAGDLHADALDEGALIFAGRHQIPAAGEGEHEA